MIGWTGRTDAGAGDAGLRWHHIVQPFEPGLPPGVALIGLASDEGIVRNQGRPGASEGPAVMRTYLANLPEIEDVAIFDAGDIVVRDGDLESAQIEYGARVGAILRENHLAIGLGGGHEIAFGSFMGLHGAVAAERRVGILNFDAHFDLRDEPRSTSGTSFLAAHALRPDARYRVMGISPTSNTRALYQRAESIGASWVEDGELTESRLIDEIERLERWLDGIDDLYLTICLDVLPASVAPGVSAPAARGVALEVLEPLIDVAARSGKLRVADVAELSPKHDQDGRTARTAARLVWRIAR